VRLPNTKKIAITVKDSDKAEVLNIAERFSRLGYTIYSTKGTADLLESNGVPAISVLKIEEGSPNLIDLILGAQLDLIINTPTKGFAHNRDGFLIRRNAVECSVPCLTSLDTATALVSSLEKAEATTLSVIDIARI
jgi:carbamoyl-phosphate synthase large subunit